MLCEENECTGCAACVSACPQKCIALNRTKFGWQVARINIKECTECLICDKVCPQISFTNYMKPKKCYAAYTELKDERLDSASGGVAHIFYKNFLSQKSNTIVFGVEWDSDIQANLAYTQNLSEISFFKVRNMFKLIVLLVMT